MIDISTVRRWRADLAAVLMLFVLTVVSEGDLFRAEIILEGEVEKKERARDTRIQTALLKQPDDSPEDPKPGTYHLRRLEVHTHAGQTLDFDNPPEGGFHFVEEPGDLPIRVDVAWALPEWHPNTVPKRR